MAIFGSNESHTRAAKGAAGETTLSIIASGTVVTGDVECAGALKVEGRVDGGVRRARQLMLAKEASIHGDVSATEVVVGGLIDGSVSASERLELQPTAVVNGDITTKSIVVMEGARINGALRMTELSLVGKAEAERDANESRSAHRR